MDQPKFNLSDTQTNKQIRACNISKFTNIVYCGENASAFSFFFFFFRPSSISITNLEMDVLLDKTET